MSAIVRSVTSGEEGRLVRQVTWLLRDLLDDQGISQAELARRIGTSRAHVSQLLAGDRNMTLETIAKLAAAIGFRITVSSEPLT